MSGTNHRKAPSRVMHPEPPAEDYTDDVSEEFFAALEEKLSQEFEGEELEVVSGPAW